MFSVCIVFRVQTGKLIPVAQKQEHVERKVDFHLGLMMSSRLSMKGDTKLNYHNMVSNNMVMTMMVMCFGGRDPKPQF